MYSPAEALTYQPQPLQQFMSATRRRLRHVFSTTSEFLIFNPPLIPRIFLSESRRNYGDSGLIYVTIPRELLPSWQSLEQKTVAVNHLNAHNLAGKFIFLHIYIVQEQPNTYHTIQVSLLYLWTILQLYPGEINMRLKKLLTLDSALDKCVKKCYHRHFSPKENLLYSRSIVFK